MMTGYVVNSANGDKVGGATVIAQDLDTNAIAATTTSGDDGSFTLDISSESRYRITASKEGYSSLAIEQPADEAGNIATVDDELIWPT